MDNEKVITLKKSIYIDRYAWKSPLFPNYHLDKHIQLIVVIPAFKETNILEALRAIDRCSPPESKVMILVVINESEESDKEVTQINQEGYQKIKNYPSRYELLVGYVRLPAKKAGVGLARKMGMDEAVRMFMKNDYDGIIVCFDADCKCQKNYLTEIEQTYKNKNVGAAIVFYEHDYEVNKDLIIQYELFLRYYIHAIRYTGFPYAFQTLGSCITVRSSVYQRLGGMNTRKAGEDFYFLNKIIPHVTFCEINKTTIYPSGRLSDRVPFGTGKSLNNMMKNECDTYKVYNPMIFEDLTTFFQQKNTFFQHQKATFPQSIVDFLGKTWKQDLIHIKNSVSNDHLLFKRFFLWFDAFKILKYVHFARDHFYANVPLNTAIIWLNNIGVTCAGNGEEEQLASLRNFDRNHRG